MNVNSKVHNLLNLQIDRDGMELQYNNYESEIRNHIPWKTIDNILNAVGFSYNTAFYSIIDINLYT